MEFKANDIEDLPGICQKILNQTSKKVMLFYGEMGAGKTTLIKSLCKVLNSEDDVSSPTFSLINHYKTNKNQNIFHFDFYRIKSPEEAMDIGFEEYLDSGDYCFIEWPDLISQLIFTEFVHIEVKAEDKSRVIKVQL